MSDAPSSNGNTKSLTLPATGFAKVKSVLSGDTVVLWGKPLAANQLPPEVLFTLQVSAPRLQSKSNPVDEPGAFLAREFLRSKLIGKVIQFQTTRQTGERAYGDILVEEKSITHQLVAEGYVNLKNNEDNEELTKAFELAKSQQLGIHGEGGQLVRQVKTAVDDFAVLSLVQACQKTKSKLTCVIENVSDGARVRCQVVGTENDSLPDFLYAQFTLLIAGITCPRTARSDGEEPAEPFAEQAKYFTTTRLLQRKVDISLWGTDKAGNSAVGTIHHPAGNIAIELLKAGLARVTDWSVRLLPVEHVPAFRIAETTAKRSNLAIWHSYTPPTPSSTIQGVVVEVISGDMVSILPNGTLYNSEDALVKIGLASIRAPRVGNERIGRPDEPYAYECKEKLRSMCVGKQVKVDVHYEREIPVGDTTEKRKFGTLSVGKHVDVSDVLVSEGLAMTQRHRDDDEKSPRYDELRQAEAAAKAAKRGVHNEKEYRRAGINDLTDSKKARAYSGALIRAGKLKAIVELCFNGALFKLFVPSENCHIRFAPNMIRCPQSSPPPGTKSAKAAEPFGDDSKRHARLNCLQRQVEIDCTGVSNSGIITGSMFLGHGSQRRDYTIELLGAGLATLDPRKVEYGEIPKNLLDAESTARDNKVGLWSLEIAASSAKAEQKQFKVEDKIAKIRLSEIRGGSHFFFHDAVSGAADAMEDSMRTFTAEHGTNGAPCDVKVNKVVAALFDVGNGPSWYRAKILEKLGTKVKVLYVDHGNVATVSASSQLRPLDMSLGTDKIPPIATEASLALTRARSLNTDEGMDAARMLQQECWGKELTARLFSTDPETGRLAVELYVDNDDSMNMKLISSGLARVSDAKVVEQLASRMVSPDRVKSLAAELQGAEEIARQTRSGMWRYGDVGDDDPDFL